MDPLVTVMLVDGVRVVVADSTRFITPYVLFEQQDWFEDELRFLRRLLEPGQRVIDIGANHGVYALSMAKVVGPTGKVLAFEPSASTAALFAQSVESNGFAQIVIERSALSDRSGTAQLTLNGHSELNALTYDAATAAATETVALTTLDECLQRYGWCDVDFVKIDAEGEESRIIEGARRFLTTQSPLVQYEIRASAGTNLELAQQFATLGYESYRLVPGLDLLVPFDASEPLDRYLLNLFACKADRAHRLASMGWLVEPTAARQAAGWQPAPAELAVYEWQLTLAGLPYAAPLHSKWIQRNVAGDGNAIARALSLRALSHDRRQAPARRFAALLNSHGLLDAVRAGPPIRLRGASFARVARELGYRRAAVEALQVVCNSILGGEPIDPSEPFLSPASRFDALDPGGALGNWVLCSAMEECERLSYFSSFYADASSMQRLNLIAGLGFPDAEMERRRKLLKLRFGEPVAS